ncbi:MAG: flagellar hook-associated protein FlgK [Dongiaceae bacterium]
MSLTTTLYTALSGLQANQSALRVVSNNVANVNTIGYTRKIADPQSRVIAGQGAGVQLGAIHRNVDAALAAEVRSTTTSLKGLELKQQFFERMQDMFGSLGSNSSVGTMITDFSNRLSGLTANPESVSLRLDAVASGVRLTERFNAMSRDTQQLRYEADRQIADAIEAVNTDLTNIQDLNDQITQAKLRNLPTGDLEDQRDLALSRISEKMQISTFTRENGEITVFTSGGRTLLDGQPQFLSHAAASGLQAAVTYPGGIDGIHLGGNDITADFRSGSIAAAIELRDRTLPALTAQTNQLAAALRDEINRIHNQGTGLPAATTLTGSRPQTGTAASYAGPVTVALTNPDGTVAFSGTLPAPATLDAAGFAAALNTALAALDPGASASVSGGTVTVNGGSYGAVVSGGTIDPGGGQPSTNLSDFLHLNDFFVGNDATGADLAGVLAVRSDIRADPSLLSRGELRQDSGGGDYVGAGDHSVLDRIVAKFNAQIDFTAVGGLPSAGTTLAGYAANILAANATAAAAIDHDVDFTTTMQQELDSRMSAQSGVNMDEELANMVVLQNAYAASARVVTVATEMFDILVSLGR